MASGSSISTIRKNLPPEYEIFGFDTFYGLPEDWSGTDLNKSAFTTNGVAPKIEGVKFFKGLFEDTIPIYLNQYKLKQCALIHIDCDLYLSAKTVFKYINPCIGPGTILVFDEWYYRSNKSLYENNCEQKAFYEWVLENKVDFSFIDCDPPDVNYEKKIVLIQKKNL